MLRYFFHELRYQKVTAQVYSFNAPSIALHERLGFQVEGRLRRMIFTHGRHFDELLYGMTVRNLRHSTCRSCANVPIGDMPAVNLRVPVSEGAC